MRASGLRAIDHAPLLGLKLAVQLQLLRGRGVAPVGVAPAGLRVADFHWHVAPGPTSTPSYRGAGPGRQTGGFPPTACRGARGVAAGALFAAASLAACRGEFDFPQREQQAAPVLVDDTPKCFVRARFFHGLVQAPCADIIREVRP